MDFNNFDLVCDPKIHIKVKKIYHRNIIYDFEMKLLLFMPNAIKTNAMKKVYPFQRIWP